MTDINWRDIKVVFLQKHKQYRVGQFTWLFSAEAEQLKQQGIVEIIGKTRYTYDELLTQTTPNIDYLVEDMVPEKGTMVLVGVPGCFKSFFAEFLCNAVAAGKDFLGKKTKQGVVLYLDEEMKADRFHERQIRIINGMGKRLNFPSDLPIFYVDDESYHKINLPLDTNALNELKFKELEHILDAVRPALVIFDSLPRFMIGDENDADNVRQIQPNLKRLIRKYSCSIIVIQHTRKAGDMIRGSSDLPAQFDCCFKLDKTGSDEYSLESFKFRDNKDRTFEFGVLDEYDLNGQRVAIDIVAFATAANTPTKKQQAYDDMKAWLKTRVSFRTKEALDDFKGKYEEKGIKMAIEKLLKQGIIIRAVRGVYDVVSI